MKTLEGFLSAYGTNVNDAAFNIRENFKCCASYNKQEPWYQKELDKRDTMLADARNIDPYSIVRECIEVDSAMLKNNRIFTPSKHSGIYFSLRNNRVKLLAKPNGVSINAVYIPMRDLKFKPDTLANEKETEVNDTCYTENNTVNNTVSTIENLVSTSTVDTVSASEPAPVQVKTKEATITLSVEIPASDVGRFLVENKRYTIKILNS